MSDVRIDSLLPQEMATKAEYLGARKAEMPFLKMFMLAVLAGAFISLGAIFATTVGAGSGVIATSGGEVAYTTGLSYGVNRLLDWQNGSPDEIDNVQRDSDEHDRDDKQPSSHSGRAHFDLMAGGAIDPDLFADTPMAQQPD